MLLVQGQMSILQRANGTVSTKEDVGGKFEELLIRFQTPEGCGGYKSTNEGTSANGSARAPKQVYSNDCNFQPNVICTHGCNTLP